MRCAQVNRLGQLRYCYWRKWAVSVSVRPQHGSNNNKDEEIGNSFTVRIFCFEKNCYQARLWRKSSVAPSCKKKNSIALQSFNVATQQQQQQKILQHCATVSCVDWYQALPRVQGSLEWGYMCKILLKFEPLPCKSVYTYIDIDITALTC